MRTLSRPVRRSLLRALLFSFGLLAPVALCLALPAPALRPAASALACRTNADCPRGLLCCPEFAYPGSPKVCKTPMNGHCPLIP